MHGHFICTSLAYPYFADYSGAKQLDTGTSFNTKGNAARQAGVKVPLGLNRQQNRQNKDLG